jgi:hypothetical protein
MLSRCLAELDLSAIPVDGALTRATEEEALRLLAVARRTRERPRFLGTSSRLIDVW